MAWHDCGNDVVRCFGRQGSMDRPHLDGSQAGEYIGKTILLGVTYVDRDDRVLGQKQWVGKILSFSNE